MFDHRVKLSTRSPPPAVCENYPPILSITGIIDPHTEFNFFIDCDEGGSREYSFRGRPTPSLSSSSKTSSHNENANYIACSFICIDHLGGGNPSSASDFVDLAPHIKTPVIILCHGLLSWRNQMLILHLAANLSKTLHCNTIRFDFMGNGHSSGTWRFASYDQDFRSLAAVVSFVVHVLEVQILCIVGHSRATCAVMEFASSDAGQSYNIPYLVNLSGRFNARNSDEMMTDQQKRDLQNHGEFEIMRRGTISYMVTSKDLEECAYHELSSIDYETIDSHVLTIHGDNDRNVPLDNALCFEEVLGKKHTLRIIEGADHNFNGLKFMSVLVEAITKFIKRLEKDKGSHEQIRLTHKVT